MKSEIEAARARQGHTAALAAEARQAREKLAAYESGSESTQMGSPGRLRDLQQEREAAEARLERLQETPADPPAEEPEPAPAPDPAPGDDDEDDDGGVRA